MVTEPHHQTPLSSTTCAGSRLSATIRMCSKQLRRPGCLDHRSEIRQQPFQAFPPTIPGHAALAFPVSPPPTRHFPRSCRTRALLCVYTSILTVSSDFSATVHRDPLPRPEDLGAI